MDLGSEQTHKTEVGGQETPDESVSPVETVSVEQRSAIQSCRARIPVPQIRTSLKASTMDGVFAAIFSNITGGVLLSNFLVQLRASSVEIGIISAIPMLANLVQPFGAWLSDRFRSRQRYCLSVYLPSRLLWLSLPIGIVLYSQQMIDKGTITLWTIVVVAFSYVLGGLGSAVWLSWMSALVPRRLRGRYFGIRNSAANLTGLIVIILAGLWVDKYPRGELEGFAIALGISIFAGVISLLCQQYMTDVHPAGQQFGSNATESERSPVKESREDSPSIPQEAFSSASPAAASHPAKSTFSDHPSTSIVSEVPETFVSTIWGDRQFLAFLAYFSGWMFALNLSAPFFNIYLLQNLSIKVSHVTLYNSLAALANILILVPFGRWSDRIGNRNPLIGLGLVMVILPILWLQIGTDDISRWAGLPLLYLLNGGANAVIDLCANNLQLEIAPTLHQAKYFGFTAAISGVSGALGTVAGGEIAQMELMGGLIGLFVISSVLRLCSLIPLFWIQEAHEPFLLKSFDCLRMGFRLKQTDSQ